MILYPEIKRIPLMQKELNRILNKVSSESKISINDLRSDSRKKECVFARFMYVKRASKRTNNKELIMSMINRDRTLYHHYLKEYVPFKR